MSDNQDVLDKLEELAKQVGDHSVKVRTWVIAAVAVALVVLLVV